MPLDSVSIDVDFSREQRVKHASRSRDHYKSDHCIVRSVSSCTGEIFSRFNRNSFGNVFPSSVRPDFVLSSSFITYNEVVHDENRFSPVGAFEHSRGSRHFKKKMNGSKLNRPFRGLIGYHDAGFAAGISLERSFEARQAARS